MLAGLFRDAVAELVADTLEVVLAGLGRPLHPALREAAPRDAAAPVLIAGDVALGRALVRVARRRGAAWSGVPLHVAAPAGHRGARKLEHVVAAEHPARLPLGEQSVAVIIGAGAMAEPSPEDSLAGWRRVLRRGGGLILVDRCAPAVASRHALCAGVVELEQRHSGRAVVTSGWCA